MPKPKATSRAATKVVRRPRSPESRRAHDDARPIKRPLTNGASYSKGSIEREEQHPIANGTLAAERQAELFAKHVLAPKEKPVKKPKPVPLWVTEGRVLDRLLKERGIGRTEFGEMIGRRYLIVNRWCQGYGFDRDNQRLAAAILGVPEAEFGERPRPARSARDILTEFRVARRGVAASLKPGDWKALEFVAVTAGENATVQMLETVAIALLGINMTTEQILAAAGMHSELDKLSHKSTPKRGRPT